MHTAGAEFRALPINYPSKLDSSTHCSKVSAQIRTRPFTPCPISPLALDTRQSKGVQVRSFQLAIERLRVRPGLAPILIHKPGPLFDESPQRQAALAEVYRRGLEEVGVLLRGVRTRPG